MHEYSVIVSKTAGSLLYDILCIESKWILNLVAHVQYISEISVEINNKNFRITNSKNSKNEIGLEGILKQNGLSIFSDDFLNSKYSLKNDRRSPSFFKSQFKGLIYNSLKYKKKSSYFTVLNPNSAACGYFDEQKYSVISGVGLHPFIHKNKREIFMNCDELIELCKPMFNKPNINSSIQNFVRKILKTRFLNSINIYEGINKKFPDVDQIYTGTGGNLTNRIVHRVIRKRGGRASIFPHGGGIGRYIKSSYIASELSTSNEYFTYNKKDKEGFEHLTKDYPGIQSSFPTFTPMGQDVERFIPFHISCKKSIKSIATRVLYIPDAYHGEETTPYVLPDLIRLEWEMFLFSIIDSRYSLFYKKHPKGFASNKILPHLHASSYFESCSLRDAFRNVDVVICDTTAATAFHEAVCSDVGIVFIKNNIVEWRKDAYETASKRVVFVDSYFDNKGRMRICQSTLNDAINISLNRKDNEFMENFIFPDKN